MKLLIKNGKVVNVFTGEIIPADVLIEDGIIIGVGDYSNEACDSIKDASDKYICPGFIDSHIHIESTMLAPFEFSKVAIPHGTTAVIADPHEIANVSGAQGIEYMLEASEGLPLTVYIMLPSCVPATPFDESGAILSAEDLKPLYSHERVLGLGEMMNYPGVLGDDADALQKIEDAKALGLTVNGHAPLLSGAALDKYISRGIADDHECTSFEEAKERIRKGQRVMIRQGTAAKNLKALLPLFSAPWNEHCLLVCDDKHPADLISGGHIDSIIREAARLGADPIEGIRMATIRAARHFGLRGIGAVAPGYSADILLLNSLESVEVAEVYKKGELVAADGKAKEYPLPKVSPGLEEKVRNSFNIMELSPEDFIINASGSKKCRIIKILPGELLTDELIKEVNFDKNNGIDIERDILKCAVFERHKGTGHRGVGFITGLGFKEGAIASSVSHDSHNLIIAGTNERDMAAAGNRIRELGGGSVVVKAGEIISEMPLPIGGVMTDADAFEIAKLNETVRESVYTLGVPRNIEPFMTTAFMSLPVIPHLKMTTHGLINVDGFELVDLII